MQVETACTTLALEPYQILQGMRTRSCLAGSGCGPFLSGGSAMPELPSLNAVAGLSGGWLPDACDCAVAALPAADCLALCGGLQLGDGSGSVTVPCAAARTASATPAEAARRGTALVGVAAGALPAAERAALARAVACFFAGLPPPPPSAAGFGRASLAMRGTGGGSPLSSSSFLGTKHLGFGAAAMTCMRDSFAC